ncbi:hypothetical protein PCASD_09423 [Puccinia coronata f. sp. avenae]|uniref:Uncharacterized protein n=1 Tax=Puccinia coronata f. sp. avenae TaxID=200324 RepID=A0A2N5UHU0_9BASI|nr:hypothetical protein PCASD_11864 [Puccinia coronata f. sp. avenae]PLW37257.1 hypothetical protein PCASD_09423 [Puccinia coronata f. sp. avenae]
MGLPTSGCLACQATKTYQDPAIVALENTPSVYNTRRDDSESSESEYIPWAFQPPTGRPTESGAPVTAPKYSRSHKGCPACSDLPAQKKAGFVKKLSQFCRFSPQN